MTKAITFGIGIALIVGGIYAYDHFAQPYEVKVERDTEVVEKEVSPEWATDEDAVKAAQAVIRKKELEAEEARLVEEITTRQDELDEVRKDLGTY